MKNLTGLTKKSPGLKGLKNLKMTNFELVRNDDLTFSALKLSIELPSINMTGKFRL